MGQPFQHFPWQLKCLSLFIHQAFEAEEPAVELELEAHKGLSQPEPEPEQISENQHPETSITQDQDSAPLLPSPDPLSGPASGLSDNPDILDIQDNIPNRQDIITSRSFSSFHKSLSVCLLCQLSVKIATKNCLFCCVWLFCCLRCAVHCFRLQHAIRVPLKYSCFPWCLPANKRTTLVVVLFQCFRWCIWRSCTRSQWFWPAPSSLWRRGQSIWWWKVGTVNPLPYLVNKKINTIHLSCIVVKLGLWLK